MGLFNKIKNILFEDDEMEEIPVFTKEEKGKLREQTSDEKPILEERKVVPEPKEIFVKHDPIKVDNNTHFSNVKRDIDFSYEEKSLPSITQDMVPKKLEMPKPKAPEKKESPFMSFDEDEFERINAHLLRNENREKEEKKEHINVKKGNSNKDKYSLESNTKRPFRPSPVISPVYGILDKNYTKDDIVDKQDGIKREIIRPVIRREIESEMVKQEEPFEVNVDSVRKKAFGSLEDLEKRALDVQESLISVEEEIVELPAYQEVPLQTEESISTYNDNEIEEIPYEDEKDSILEHLKKDILEDEEESVESILDKAPLLEEDEIVNEVPEEQVRGRILDDMEKTSTLQILDDIEKELNAIKPITKEYKGEESLTEKERLEKNDTLENDLFDLIDSMYEEGEEEEDND